MPGDLFAPITTTDELLAATGDRAWLQAMLDAEAALARAEAASGVIPVAAAEAIAAACDADRFDPADLGRAARAGGNPVLPLSRALAAAVPDDARRWVHWGATSQDILDTAAMLVARRSLVLVGADLGRLAAGCAALADRHRDTPITGRTLLQPALPITLGFKAAAWLAGVTAARRQLDDAGAGLAAQLGGACGTLASLGEAGPDVLAGYARRLGLAEPPVAWHTARQRVTVLAAALGTAAGTAAKIAGDVALLMQAEVGEAFEPAAPGRGGSSTLPHKRNPVSAAVVDAAARRTQALVGVLFAALVGEHERPVGAWHAEWETLSELLALAGGAVARTADTVTGLEVDEQAMAANLAGSGEILLAEAVGLALASAGVERVTASDAVAAAARRATTSGGGFAAELEAEPTVAANLNRDQIEALLRPDDYLHSCGVWIDRALADAKEVGQ